ncbi:MAG: DUF6194 family protein [Maribacter sp.]
MTAEQLENWILSKYDGIIVTNAYRERSFFYNPDYSLKKGIYFTTIKESDGPNDKASDLNRDNIYRISIGIGKNDYEKLFGPKPKRPAKGGVVDIAFDFTQKGVLMPHPVYAWMGWVAFNNPTTKDLGTIEKLLDISYQNSKIKFSKKKL